MSGHSRARVLLPYAVALATLVVQPAIAAATESSPPSNDGFGLSMDEGERILALRDGASRTLEVAQPRLESAIQHRDELQASWDTATQQLVALGDARTSAESAIAVARAAVQATAASAYVDTGTGRLDAVIGAALHTDNALDVERTMHLISLGSNRELRTLRDALNTEHDIDAQLLDVSQQRSDTREQLDQAVLHVSDLQAVVDDAKQRAAEADVRLERFNTAAVTASSPILGPTRLNARQLADFVRQSGYSPRLTVSLDELATLFIDESEKVGVRGDVAWAQSILETGGFGFAGSMVEPEDNNFAGIGACDSCHRGTRFTDARTGVRAQMQLLRIYVDKSVKDDSFPDALVMPRTLRLGFRGAVQSWADLAGTWATAPDYGAKVYAIYERMIDATATIPP